MTGPKPFAPNLIMPGVAKCGTTTLHAMLVAHPQIQGGLDKEVRYLMDARDELARPANVRDRGLEGWAERFPHRGEGNYRYWLDASPAYQYNEIAREVIGALDPAPRLIFTVRRPSDRIYSLYQFARYTQKALPEGQDFPAFVAAIRPPVDASLDNQNMMVNAWVNTQYDRMLDQWRTVVPHGNIWLTSVEALKNDRDGELHRLADWLGLDAAPLLADHGAHANATVRTRSRMLRRLGARAAKVLPENRLTRAAKDFVRGLNTAPLDRSEKPANAALLAEIDAEFAPHVHRFNAMAAEHQPHFRPLPV